MASSGQTLDTVALRKRPLSASSSANSSASSSAKRRVQVSPTLEESGEILCLRRKVVEGLLLSEERVEHMLSLWNQTRTAVQTGHLQRGEERAASDVEEVGVHLALMRGRLAEMTAAVQARAEGLPQAQLQQIRRCSLEMYHMRNL